MHLAQLLLFSFLFSVSSFAQQELLNSNFWLVQSNYLPAMTGVENKHEAVVLARDQWIGLNGRPRNINAQYTQKLEKINSGIGFIYQAQKNGFSHTHKAKLSYAYHLKIGEKQLFSVGTNVGVSFYKMKANWIPPTPNPDPAIQSEFLQTNLIADFGVNYKLSNWQIGIGSTQFTLQRKTDHFTYARYYFLQSSYQFQLGKQMELSPRLLFQTNLVKVAATLNTQLKINPFLQVGLMARSTKFLGANIGCFFLKNFYLSYHAEISFGQMMSLGKYYTHEAVLSYRIPD